MLAITIALVAIGGVIIAYAQHKARQERQENEVDHDLQYFAYRELGPMRITGVAPASREAVTWAQIADTTLTRARPGALTTDDPWTVDNRLADPPEYDTNWRT